VHCIEIASADIRSDFSRIGEILKTAGMRLMIVLLALSFVTACSERQVTVDGETTATIAPAAPQPEATGTDAMTQTVYVEEDDRAPSEGEFMEEEAPAREPLTAPPPTTTTR
jgi:hypothetical protein